jgi:hypothetical protein
MQACQALLDAAIKAGGTKTPKAPTAQQLAQGRKFSQCMRAHGVTDFPDPQSAGSGNGGGISIQVSGGGGSDLDPNNPTFTAAQKACRALMPGKAGGGTVTGGGVMMNGGGSQ